MSTMSNGLVSKASTAALPSPVPDQVSALLQQPNRQSLVDQIVFGQQDSRATFVFAQGVACNQGRDVGRKALFVECPANRLQQFSLLKRPHQVCANSKFPTANCVTKLTCGGEHHDLHVP